MKSKKKIIALIITLIIVIAGGVFAYLYFMTDMFKTPEDLFYQYIGKAAKSETDYSYQDILEDIKTAQTKSYKGKSTIGVEVDAKGTSYSARKNQTTFDLLKAAKINIETKSNPSEKKAQYNVGIQYAGINITDVDIVKDADMYGVKSEFLNDKYIAVENKNLKDLAKKLGLSSENIPDKIEALDLYDLLYISKEDQDKIKSTYKEVLKNNIPADKYKKEENIVKNINNEDKNTTAYSLTINQKELYNIVISVLEKAKDDDTLLDLITDKFEKLMSENLTMNAYVSKLDKSNKALSITKNTKLSKKDLVNTIESIIDELKDEVDNTDEKSVAEMIVYVSNGETSRIEFKVNNEVITAMDFFKVDDKEHIVLYGQKTNYSSYKRYSFSTATTKELSKVMEIEYKTTKNGEETRKEATILAYEDNEVLSKLIIDTTTKGKAGEGKNESASKLTVENEELSVTLNINSEVEYTDDVDIEELDSKNSIVLNDMKQTELKTFFDSIPTNAQKVLQNKMKSLGLSSAAMR